MTENPRFPHRCEIYRMDGGTSFTPELAVIKTLYSGICRKSSSTNIRTFNTGTNTTGKVDIADYRVSMPGIIKGIQKGDRIDVADLIGIERGMRIVTVNASIMANATEVFCNTSSN